MMSADEKKTAEKQLENVGQHHLHQLVLVSSFLTDIKSFTQSLDNH